MHDKLPTAQGCRNFYIAKKKNKLRHFNYIAVIPTTIYTKNMNTDTCFFQRNKASLSQEKILQI